MDESKKHENGKSSSVSENDANIHEPWYWYPSLDPKEKAEAMKSGIPASMLLVAVDPKYYDFDEANTQVRLWYTIKKHPWKDAPAKVKVKMEKGICRVNIEFTLGWPPQPVYEMFTNPRNLIYFRIFDNQFRQRLDNTSTKVLKKDGPRQITEVNKILSWDFFSFSGSIPIHLIIDENHQNLTANYKEEKMMCMKVFEGSWKVEPLYVDQERGFTIKTIKALLEDLRKFIIDMHKLE